MTMPSEKVSDGIFFYLHIKSNIIFSLHDISLNFLEFQYETSNLLRPFRARRTRQSLALRTLANLAKPFVNVGEMAAEFAQVFGAREIACQTGRLYDLGKYSEAFNYRLHGGLSVDHATAGAKIAKMLALEWRSKYNLLLSHLG